MHPRRILLIGHSGRLARRLGTLAGLEDVWFERTAGAADALRRTRMLACDVIVTDGCVPITEALALVNELRHVRPGVAVIVVAPRETPPEVADAMRARVRGCLVDPVDEPELGRLIRECLENPDWRAAITVVSAHPEWITIRANCRLLSPERLAAFFAAAPARWPREWRESDLFVLRDVLLKAADHGGEFDPERTVELSAIRTRDTIVYHVHDLGPAFRPDAPGLHAWADASGDALAHFETRDEPRLRTGAFAPLVVRRVVDEVLFSQPGNEVLLIKHLA